MNTNLKNISSSTINLNTWPAIHSLFTTYHTEFQLAPMLAEHPGEGATNPGPETKNVKVKHCFRFRYKNISQIEAFRRLIYLVDIYGAILHGVIFNLYRHLFSMLCCCLSMCSPITNLQIPA